MSKSSQKASLPADAQPVVAEVQTPTKTERVATEVPTSDVPEGGPNAADLISALERIRTHLRITPVMTSSILDEMCGRQLFFKCEHLQRTGSFKARGALNALLNMPEGYKGVVTHSSGNHGQALAWAAARFNCTCTVVVAEDTPDAKVQAMRSYGAEVHFCRPNFADRRRMCEQLAQEGHLYHVPSSDHWDVIAGQASIGLELMEQVPDLDCVLAPISGGGLAAGLAIASSTLGRVGKDGVVQPTVHCVEALGKSLTPSLLAGRPQWEAPDNFVDTLADSIRLRAIGPIALSVLHRLADRQFPVFSVADSGMSEGVRLASRYLKQTVEAASGAAIYAAVHLAANHSCRKIGVILSGGNLDTFSPDFAKLVAALQIADSDGGRPRRL